MNRPPCRQPNPLALARSGEPERPMAKPKPNAPYQPGDRVRPLLMDRQGATSLAVVTLDRVTPVSDGRSWRIAGQRPGNPHPDPARDCPASSGSSTPPAATSTATSRPRHP